MYPIAMSNAENMPGAAPVTRIIDTLDAAVAHGPAHANDVLAAFGRTAIAPLLAVPALLIASPLSAIPLFSSFCGLAIILIALQGAVGRRNLWLPRFLRNRSLPEKRTQAAARTLRPVAAWLDWATHHRLSLLVAGPMARVLYLLCAFVATFIPLLEFIPLSSSIVGAGIALIAIGILARDGLFAIVGLVVLCCVPVIPFIFVSTVAEIV